MPNYDRFRCSIASQHKGQALKHLVFVGGFLYITNTQGIGLLLHCDLRFFGGVLKSQNKASQKLCKSYVMIFVNIIGLPGHRNKKGKCFGNNKNVLFLNSNYKIIEQHIPMLFLDLVTPCSLYRILMSFRIGNDDVIVILYG